MSEDLENAYHSLQEQLKALKTQYGDNLTDRTRLHFSHFSALATALAIRRIWQVVPESNKQRSIETLQIHRDNPDSLLQQIMDLDSQARLYWNTQN